MKRPSLRELGSYSKKEIDNLVANFERQGLLNDPDYLRLLAEQERRKTKGLDFEKTLAAIRTTAAQDRYLPYKGVAEASGVDFAAFRNRIGDHLTRLCGYAHRHRWPLISAVVVNKSGEETGLLEARSLGGFIGAARSFGYVVTDEEAFVRDQQDRTFAWAKQPLMRPS